jgi:ATP-binding cassette subfamily F protein 3
VLRIEGLSKSFGGRVLFHDADLHVRPGDRIGLVGRNGAGKTTLLRILAGLEPPDDGRILPRKGARIGYLQQEIDPSSHRSVLEEAQRALAPLHALEQRLDELRAEVTRCGEQGGELPESLIERLTEVEHAFEAAGGFEAEAQLRATLSGLGLGAERWNAPLSSLSGGWLMRVELAKLLIARPEVLLLDEPTNHLDLPSIRWFEGVLSSYPGAIVVVSHDRTFLDRHCNRIAELAGERLTTYTGGYSDYEQQRGARHAQVEARARNLDREIADKQRFVDRFGAKATKARQAQSRKKSLDKLRGERASLDAALAGPAARMRVRFECTLRSGELVLRMEDVGKAYGSHVVYEHLDLEIRRGERVALVGPNGAGKSTLLRMLSGELAPDHGTVEAGHNVRRAFFAQHHVDDLDPARSVLETLADAAQLDDVPRLRGILGAFLFPGDDVLKKVSILSGGEKSRLALARLLLDRPNTLILDEPTNHLDIEARDVLTDALDGYEGTLLFVSHDRRFVNALATRVIEVTHGAGEARVRSYPGDYDAFERALEGEAGAQVEPVRGPQRRRGPARESAGRERERQLRKLRARAHELETEIESLEARIAGIDAKFTRPEIARDGDQMRALSAERQACSAQLVELYSDWEAAGSDIAEIDRAAEGSS